MIKAAIYGASGYAGGELLRLLLDHPKAEPIAVISRSQAGQPVAAVHAHLSRLTDMTFIERAAEGRRRAGGHLSRGRPRLRVGDRAGAARHGHPGRGPLGRLSPEEPGLLREVLRARPRGLRAPQEFVYGLPELFREQIAAHARRRVARLFRDGLDPGPGAPLASGLVDETAPVAVFAITGSSGAGVTPSPTTHHPRRASAFFAYCDRRPPPSAGDRGVALGGRQRPPRADRLPDALGALSCAGSSRWRPCRSRADGQGGL